MGRRDIGRPRQTCKEQKISSFQETGSRTYSLDTFGMVVAMKRGKALDMPHTECHESAGLFYRLSEQRRVSRLVEFTRFWKYETVCYDREFMKRELLTTSLTACGSWSAACEGDVCC
jgi:hypothetical protein